MKKCTHEYATRYINSTTAWCPKCGARRCVIDGKFIGDWELPSKKRKEHYERCEKNFEKDGYSYT